MSLENEEKRRLREAAESFEGRHHVRAASAEWDAHRVDAQSCAQAVGLGELMGTPILHLDDVSAIPFLSEIVGMEFYQLRARVRAENGDVYVATCPELKGYERYNQERLQLGRPGFVYAETVSVPAAVGEACQHGEAFDSLVEFAKSAGKLLIHPYMGTEPVWDLAQAIAQSAGVQVRVVAPPPPMTWFSNDKEYVSEVACAVLADDVLGGTPIAETKIASSVRGLANHLRALVKRHERVVLKMTRCASAMGNILYTRQHIEALDDGGLEDAIREALVAKEWQEGSNVLACAWLDASSSPSTQLWIPPLAAGEPVMEGVYEQLLTGPECVFLGSIPSGLGKDMDSRLIRASLRMATVYQQLGYVGRCSFDFVIQGDNAYLVECNGRWGGTSSPMHLVDRIWSKQRPSYRARDYISNDWVGAQFDDLAAALGDSLYDARTGEGTFVLYNVGCLESYGKFDVIAIGDDGAAANTALEDELPRLLGD